MTDRHSASSSVRDFLDSVHLGSRQLHKSLTIWPLIGGIESTLEYVPLALAIEKGWIVVDELSEGGRVPTIRVRNRGDLAALSLFGEELVGAKQTRIANASFLVAPKSDLLIDVSCVEQGRWSAGRGTPFASGGSVVAHSIRSSMQRQVAASRATGSFEADQSEVWEAVSERLDLSGARSFTGAYQDYAESRRTDCEEILRAFHFVPGQVGFVAAIHDEVRGAELLGRPEVLERLLPGLLSSYAIDAVDWESLRSRRGRALYEAPEPFLGVLRDARWRQSASLGLGEDLRLEGDGVEGSALDADGIVHLTASVVDAPPTPRFLRRRSAGARRRH